MNNDIGNIFNAWGKDDRADGMEDEHWPVVKQAFDLIPSTSGDYLEIGVGNGYAIRHMATHQFAQGRCLGLDVSREMTAIARKRCADVENIVIENADFLTWNFPDFENFSLIFSMEVFYYFPEIQNGIDRAYSLLKPGGQLWVLVDYYNENTITHDWPEKYEIPIHLWSEKNYHHGFKRAGFSGIEQRYFQYPQNSDSPSSGLGTLCTSGTRVT